MWNTDGIFQSPKTILISIEKWQKLQITIDEGAMGLKKSPGSEHK